MDLKMNIRKRQFQHARARCWERFGIHLTQEDLIDMVAQIQSGNAVFVQRKNRYCTVWWVEAKQRWRRVYYDTNTGLIATVLPGSRKTKPTNQPG